MVQRGKRAVYEPEALAFERPTPTNESEYRRKVRMFEHSWLIVLRGRMLRGQRPGYFLALLSHRHLRYASGLLHLILLGSSIALVGHAAIYAVALGVQLGVLAAALFGVGTRPLLRPHHLGDGRRALELPPAGRARDLGAAARGGRLNRAADIALAGSALVVASPLHRARRPGGQARGRRPGSLPADPRRPGRRRLRAAQAADDGRRRRDDGGRPLGQPRRLAHHARRPASCASSRSTSCRSCGTSSAAR